MVTVEEIAKNKSFPLHRKRETQWGSIHAYSHKGKDPEKVPGGGGYPHFGRPEPTLSGEKHSYRSYHPLYLLTAFTANSLPEKKIISLFINPPAMIRNGKRRPYGSFFSSILLSLPWTLRIRNSTFRRQSKLPKGECQRRRAAGNTHLK